MVKYIIDTDRISIDYDESRELDSKPAYRITLYDMHGHFDDEFFIDKEQFDVLKEMK
jgi:hypothetical protein